MFVKHQLSIGATAITLALGLGALSCTDDKKPEEVVTPSSDSSEATPPDSAPTDVDFSADAVYFAFDDYNLNAEGQDRLKKLADQLQADSKAVVQVEGHCDERGSIEYNLALGERRAQSAKNYLVQLGIDGARVTTISYGEEKPVAQGHDESAWSRNRRDEFNVTSN